MSESLIGLPIIVSHMCFAGALLTNSASKGMIATLGIVTGALMDTFIIKKIQEPLVEIIQEKGTMIVASIGRLFERVHL